MKTWIRFFAAATMAVMATAAGAAELARWNSHEVANPLAGSFAPTAIADGLTVSNLTAGSGLLLSGINPAANSFSAGSYDKTSAEDAMSGNDWWETCLDAGTNGVVLESLMYAFRASRSGPKSAQWAWSSDRTNWYYLGEEEIIDNTWVERTAVDLREVPDASRIWLRTVVWGGGLGATAWGGFGREDVLKIYGEVLPLTRGPTVEFRPESPLAYVGETLTVEVLARPPGAEVTSITVNPMPEGSVTPNLSEGTWTFVPANADINKNYMLTVAVSNAFGVATGSVEVLVKGTEEEENGVTWGIRFIGETITVTGAYPSAGELIIPSFLGEYPVTSIGECAFSNCNELTSVTIPDSVTNIASNAFADCSGLTSVTIPQVVCDQGVPWVFPASYRFLTNVTIETTVTRIGDYAFFGCKGLTSMSIPDSVTRIGRGAFSGCSGLTSITIPKSVDRIEYETFSYCTGLTSVTFENGLKSIESNAFSYCSGLQTVAMAGSVTNIGQSAFSGCSNLVELALSDGLINIETNAFADCCSLKTLNIPHFLESIKDRAFMGCSSMSSLSIGRGVRSIGNQAFADCTSLKTVIFCPQHVSYMGTCVFSNCTSLASVMVSGNMNTKDVSSPFSTCSNLDLMVFGGNVTAIANLCRELTNLTAVLILPGVPTIGNQAFYGCSSLKTLKIPEGVLHIGNQSFTGCSSLTSLAIPNTVRDIGTQAFKGCKSLATLYVPASWKGTHKLDNAGVPSTCSIVYGKTGSQEVVHGYETIGNVSWTYAVSNCEASIVHVPAAEGELVLPAVLAGYIVTTIDAGTFSECTALMSLTIPDSVTNVAADAFSGCIGLHELHVPAWWIGTGILADVAVPATCEIVYGEDGLAAESLDGVTWYYIVVDDRVTIMDVYPSPKSLIVPAMLEDLTVGKIAPSAFAGCNALESVFLPESVTKIGRFAFQECPALQTVTMLGNITDDWTNEGDSPFGGCSNLTTVNFGNGMTKIGNYMFDNCCALQSVTIPDSITNIGNRAFGFCSSLASLDMGQGLVRIGDATFRACAALKSVNIPKSVITIGQHAFYQCTGLEEVAIGSGTRTIYQAAFRDCSSLRSVTLPDGVTRIGNETFYNCRSLPTLWIPASVTNIGREVFSGCSSLETLWVPAFWEGTDMLYDADVPYGCKICYYNPDAGENETMTTPVPVPYGWLEDNAAALLAANTNDYEATASMPAANGYPVWECYLAGLSTTNATAVFQMKSISFVDGELILKWEPDLNDGGEKTNRVYMVEGTETLEGAWGETNAASRFFRVKVEMPQVGD